MLKRTKPLQRNKTQLKRSGKIRSKPKTEDQLQEQRGDIERMWKLFEEHWELKRKGRYHYCENCGMNVWSPNKTLYHHHILEKGIERYEHLKYEMDNLMLLCSDCHTAVGNGYPGENVIKATIEAHKRFNI